MAIIHQSHFIHPLSVNDFTSENSIIGYRFCFLGQVGVSKGERSSISLPARALELLAYLLLHRERPHAREMIAGNLWGETSSEQSRKYLRQTLWHLQSNLDGDGDERGCRDIEPILAVDGGWLQINSTADVYLDTETFTQTFVAVRGTPGREMTPGQVERLEEAVALYKGDLLPGWYQTWCLVERERFRAMYLSMNDRLVEHALAWQRYEEGIQYSLRMLRLDSLRERNHRQLMRLYYLSGDRSSALRQYQRCVDLLESEFNLPPTRSTQELYEAIRSGAALASRPSREHAQSRKALDSPEASATAPSDAVQQELQQIHRYLEQLLSEVERLRQSLR